ncbi:MAG: hypothetical protein NT178_14905 [Proteobacteria bacterium]|nr:hypothetical protein [Pseudomonadota bacterium]
MSIMDDIKRLGIKLETSEKDEIKNIIEHITREKEDEFVRDALIEGAIGEFINETRPDVMEALIAEKDRQNKEWIRMSQRKFDEKGNRICDEQHCSSIIEVAQCNYCGKYICKEHNFLEGSKCCYGCWVFNFGEKKQ